jgi:hypothetical protein
MLHPCLLVLEIQNISYILVTDQFKGTDTYGYYMAPFGCANKSAEKHYWLICCERKTLFRLKKQAEKYGL